MRSPSSILGIISCSLSVVLLISITGAILGQATHCWSYECSETEIAKTDISRFELSPCSIDQAQKEMEIISGFVEQTHQSIIWWRGFYLTILMGVLGYYFYFSHIKNEETKKQKAIPKEHIYAFVLVLLLIFSITEFIYQTWQTQKLNRLCLLDIAINKHILKNDIVTSIFLYKEHLVPGTLFSPSFFGFYLPLNLFIFLFLGRIEGDFEYREVFTLILAVFFVIIIIAILVFLGIIFCWHSLDIFSSIAVLLGFVVAYWRYELS